MEARDAAVLEEITPAYERIAVAPGQRLFAKISDGDLKAFGIDEETLRQPRALTIREQLEVFDAYDPKLDIDFTRLGEQDLTAADLGQAA